jgi:hypothetical protein
MTPWPGRGPARLLPHTAAQLAVGIALPAVIIGCVARGVLRPFGEASPPPLSAVLYGLSGALFPLAAFGRRVHSSEPAATEAAPAPITTSYAAWPVLGVVPGPPILWDRRRRRRRGVREPSPSMPRRYVAAAIPVVFVLLPATAGFFLGT